jgi:hypothetical protein
LTLVGDFAKLRAMTRRRPPTVAAALLAASLLALGCSFSYSSQSSSDSSRSSSVSSSSSSPGHAERAYREDVREYTSAYIQSGGQIDAFRRKLSELAADRGITDWQTNLVTFEAIGLGLGDAKASEIQVDTFKTNLCGGDPERERAMQQGYDRAR